MATLGEMAGMVIRENPVPVVVSTSVIGAGVGYVTPGLLNTIATTLGGLTAKAASSAVGLLPASLTSYAIDTGFVAGMSGLVSSYPVAAGALLGGAGLTATVLTSPLWLPPVEWTAGKVIGGVSWAWNQLPNCRNRGPVVPAPVAPLAPPPPAPVALTSATVAAAINAGLTPALTAAAAGAAAAGQIVNLDTAGKAALAANASWWIAANAAITPAIPEGSAAVIAAAQNAAEAAVRAATVGAPANEIAAAVAAARAAVAARAAIPAPPAPVIVAAAGAAAAAADPANAAAAARSAAFALAIVLRATDAQANAEAATAAGLVPAPVAAAPAPVVAVVEPTALQSIYRKIPPTSTDKGIATASAVALVAIGAASSVALGLVAGTVGLACLGAKKYKEYKTITHAEIALAQERAAAQAALAPFNRLRPFDLYANLLKIEATAEAQPIIAETPPTIVMAMANENGIVAASLQGMLTPPRAKRLPKAIKKYLREADLFPAGVKEVHLQNPGLNEGRRNALVAIGNALRPANGTITEAEINNLRVNLKILGEGGLPAHGINKKKVNELLVLLEFRQCYRNQVIPADDVAGLYASLRRLEPEKFPPEMKNCSPLILCKTISVLMEDHPEDESQHVVRFIEKPRPGEREPRFTYVPEEIVTVMAHGYVAGLNPTADVVTAGDGSTTTYRASSYITWEPNADHPETGAPHATATVARAKGAYKYLNYHGKNDTWTNCDNQRLEQHRECPFTDPEHIRHAYLVFSRKA